MRLTRIFILSLVAVLVTISAQAQDGNASEMKNGSFYSFYGAGYPVNLSVGQERGMGILGVSLDNSQVSTLQNPAIWGRNAFTTATSGFDVNSYSATDLQTKSKNGTLEASFLQLTLPISREKLGLSASLYPVTRSNYRILEEQTIYPGPSDTLTYTSDNQGVGGINKLEFGLGWKINENISVGYAPSFVFMTKIKAEEIYLGQSEFSSANTRNEVRGTGIGHRFGVLLSQNNFFRNRDRLSIGASLTLPVNFEVEESTKTDRFINGEPQEVQIGDTQVGNLNLPLEINTGLTYYPSNLVNVSLEGQMQKWSEFEYELNSATEQVMSDRYQLGLGGQYHAYRLGSDRFLSQFRYSAGLTYDTGHLTLSDQDIQTLWLSAGIGIISPQRSQSTVDISFRYGFRGTTTNNLVKEEIWAINFSVNLAELMFFKRRLR
ncbi:MAG: hypothetical protein FH748_11420 [Balneolaceae bacterium]|nr:hypothetical protein [Balneolaceae bacterium]